VKIDVDVWVIHAFPKEVEIRDQDAVGEVDLTAERLKRLTRGV